MTLLKKKRIRPNFSVSLDASKTERHVEFQRVLKALWLSALEVWFLQAADVFPNCQLTELALTWSGLDGDTVVCCPSTVLLDLDRVLSGSRPQSVRDSVSDNPHAAARNRKYVVHDSRRSCRKLAGLSKNKALTVWRGCQSLHKAQCWQNVTTFNSWCENPPTLCTFRNRNYLKYVNKCKLFAPSGAKLCNVVWTTDRLQPTALCMEDHKCHESMDEGFLNVIQKVIYITIFHSNSL